MTLDLLEKRVNKVWLVKRVILALLALLVLRVTLVLRD